MPALSEKTPMFFLLLAAAVVVILVLWQMPDKPFKKVPVALNIAVSRSPLSAPLYVADELGFFNPQCIDVNLQEVIGGKMSFEAVVNEQADFGTSSESVIVFNSFQRRDFVNLATFVQSDNDIKIITREGGGIFKGADFRGKKVGLIKGSASEYFFSTFLALEGVSLEELNIVALSPDQLPEALKSAAVDAVVPWEPYGYITVKALGGKANVIPSKNLYTLSFNLITRKEYLAAHPIAARCVLEGLQKAIDFIAYEPEKFRQILQDRLGLDNEFSSWIWQDYLFKLSLSRSLKRTLESQARWAMDNNLVEAGEIPNFNHFLNTHTLEEMNIEGVSFNGHEE